MPMELGKETASLTNHIMSADPGPQRIEIGMGATVLGWSDRRAGTIIDVTDKYFVVQRDRAIRTDDRGMSEMQEYRFERDPKGATDTFKRVPHGKNKGQWRENGRASGCAVVIGIRDEYYDFTF